MNEYLMQMPMETLERLLSHALAQGADLADAVWFKTTDIGLSCRQSKLEGLERSESQILNLRVLVGQSQAMVSSTDYAADTLTKLVDKAITMAKATPPDPLLSMADPALYPANVPELDLCEAEEPEIDELFALAKQTEEAALLVEGITNSEGADASYTKNGIVLAIARDGEVTFNKQYASSHSSLSVSVLAGSGTEMQRDYEFSTARHRSDLLSPETIGKIAANKTLARMHPRKIGSIKSPVIYDPRVSRQLLSSFASCINGSNVVRGATFLKDAMGSNVFASGISIIDDPLRVRGLASRPFDGEGVAAETLRIVEDGKLQHWLLDTRSAKALGLATNGRASRGIGAPPSPSRSNFYMEAGTASPEALMKQMHKGLLITETFGTGINAITGDYSQGASGFWVENGEIAYPVAEITVAGHLKEMFAGAVPANDLEFRYGTNAPSLFIDGMMIAGT